MTKLWKILGVIAIVAALGAVVAMPALADGPDTTMPMWERVRQWFGGNDANGAGAFIDEDGDGVCDVCGGVPGEGLGYGNGNSYGSGDELGLAPADGTGNAYGRGQWANGASQFVDEDGDGICDICGEECDGLGLGAGMMGGMMRGGRAR